VRSVPETILVVDDNAVNRRLLRAILTKAGYCPLEAESGDAALALAAAQPPDLVLLDVMMPGKDGYAVCGELKHDTRTASIPVIFLSALTEPGDKVKGLALGAVDYVSKPFDHAEVLARVRNHLSIQRLTRELMAANSALLEKQQVLDADLRAAADIQRCLIPKGPPPSSAVRTVWHFEPCDRVGGDVFGFYFLDPTHLALYVVDVSGHGVPAAMVTVSVSQSLSLQGGLTVHRQPEHPGIAAPAEVLAGLEREYPIERFERHFTACYLVLDCRTGLLRASRAGHPCTALLRVDGALQWLEAGGTLIGLGPLVPFDEDTVQLQPGERLFLYTDGITEFANSAGELYGAERFAEQVRCGRGDTLAAACARITDDVARFAGGRPPQDDVTLLAVEYCGPAATGEL